jgi:hypothetical protein
MDMAERRKCLRVFAALAILALWVACGSRITRENYQRIHEGMTREEVIAILGEPTDSAGLGVGGFSAGTAIWKAEDGTTISVQFVNDKVKARQFSQGDE